MSDWREDFLCHLSERVIHSEVRRLMSCRRLSYFNTQQLDVACIRLHKLHPVPPNQYNKGELELEDRKTHMLECAMAGVVPAEWEDKPSPFMVRDFRTALLMIGAPTSRYHHQAGLMDKDQLLSRVEWIETCSSFCEQHFGTIGAHGSFVPRFVAEYEDWFTQCVTNLESKDG